MPENPQASHGIQDYFSAIQELQTRVISVQTALLAEIAGCMAATVQAGKRIFIFGTGHSHMLAEEGFFRAGGLAAVTPIFSSAMMLHENPALSSKLERTSGFAAILLDRFSPLPGEMIFVVSNSGVNALPVEMALEARQRDLISVALCSLEYARVAPLSPSGRRLFEICDYCIDNGGAAGDALVPIENAPWRVGSSSTVVNALIWNCLVTETAYRIHQAGGELPVFASLNMAGAREHNQGLLETWGKVNPLL